MPENNKINYVEFAVKNMAATKAFFTEVFNWSFEDYGQEYTAFSDQGIDGGFYPADKTMTYEASGAMVIFYADDLEGTQTRVEAAGGTITRPIFSFPGGRRFHFTEPSGNELAAWSDKGI